MKLVQAATTFLKKEAQKIADAQASQQAFQDALTKQVEEKGLTAVTRAKKPLAI